VLKASDKPALYFLISFKTILYNGEKAAKKMTATNYLRTGSIIFQV